MKKKRLSFLLAVLLSLTLALPAGAEETVSAGQDKTGYTVILHTNDVHGGIDGYAVIAALKQDYEARGASVLLVDAGDFVQGSSSVSINKGESAVELMNLAGYDYAAVGNHEFDYGYDRLAELQQKMAFPLLSCNVQKDGEAVFQTEAVCTLSNGKTVGIFGVTTPETGTLSIGARDLTFLGGEELYTCVQNEVDTLKTEKKCDMVLCLSHMGLHGAETPSTLLLDHVTGIDYMIDGHSHEILSDYADSLDAKGKYNGTILTSTGTGLENVGIIEIAPDGETTVTCQPVADLTVTPNAVVAAKIAEITAMVEEQLGTVIGTAEVLLDGEKSTNRCEETNLGDLVTDAMLWKAEQYGLSVDAAIENGGGIRASIPVGEITLESVKNVLPFYNTLCCITVTGSQLLEALEAATYSSPAPIGAFPQVSGINYVLNIGAPYAAGEVYEGTTIPSPTAIQRVTILSVGGEAFDPEATYSILVNDYLAGGGDTYSVFSKAEQVIDSGVALDNILAENITEKLNGVVDSQYAEPAGRIMEVNYPDVLASDWFSTAVCYNTFTGTMNGTDNGFEPNTSLNRAMMVTTLYRMAGSPALEAEAENPFTDVETGTWYSDAVLWANQNGIANGMEEEYFVPDGEMTREQMATFLYRFAQYMERPTEETGTAEELFYSDGAQVSDYAVPAIRWACHEGLLAGMKDGTLNPQGITTRAQVATVLMRYNVD